MLYRYDLENSPSSSRSSIDLAPSHRISTFFFCILDIDRGQEQAGALVLNVAITQQSQRDHRIQLVPPSFYFQWTAQWIVFDEYSQTMEQRKLLESRPRATRPRFDHWRLVYIGSSASLPDATTSLSPLLSPLKLSSLLDTLCATRCFF